MNYWDTFISTWGSVGFIMDGSAAGVIAVLVIYALIYLVLWKAY